MDRALEFRPSAAQRTHWVLEISRAVGAPAMVARITVLVGSAALGARALDEAIGQKYARFGVEELRNLAFGDVVVLAQGAPDLGAILAIALGVRAAIVIERDLKAGEVTAMSRVHVGNQLDFAAALLPRANHDRRTVRVVGAHVDHAGAAHPLKAHPDVRLDVFDEMPEVNVSVGVRQSAGHQDAARGSGAR